MDILPAFTKPAGKLPRVVFCESFDQRVLRAGHMLNQHRLAQVVLLGKYDELERTAVGYRTSLDGIEVLDYESEEMQAGIKTSLAKTDAEGSLDATDPVVAAAWLARNRVADVVIGGATSKPSHVLRIYLKVLGVAEDCKTVSGLCLAIFAGCQFLRNQMIGLADVSVVPEPSVEQLADIAIQSAANYERITGAQARVAFLSFSTLGSSDDPAARKVRDAVRLTRSRKPDLAAEGEMQIDAALIPAVAGAKSPSSSVAGNANVLIFPNLSAGNIAVKILQKFSGHRIIGPILQGLRRPAAYVQRASSAEDIVDQVRLLTT